MRDPKKVFYRQSPWPISSLSLFCSLAIALSGNAGVLITESWGQSFPPNTENPDSATEEIREQPFFPEEAIADPPATFDPDNSVPPRGYIPSPFDDPPSNQFNSYLLGINDAISISVPRFPEFQTATRIDPQGNVNIPLLGAVEVNGLTVEEAKTKISLELGARLLREAPEVFVNLESPRETVVTVLGAVSKPGYYVLPFGSDPVDAILTAQGSLERADLREIIVRRTLVDGTILERKVDFLTPLIQGQPQPELFLQGGDAVIVPELELGEEKDYDSLLASRSNIAQPFIVVRVLNYPGRGIGQIQLPGGSTFVDAIAQLNPASDTSNLRKIGLVRFDPEQGRAVTQILDGKAAFLGDLSQDIPLKNHDVIVVNRSLLAKLTYTLNVFTQPFRDILGFLLFFDQLSDSANNLFNPSVNQ
ncbi:polysaccharide biosynthesis/export family protein [Spirulina sp. 06S082]|uniref:polysaccharide biosynthesis/export family protein n=1 Tax=Spirulina sp. 06S082 TaxID=3110248 RepID=UPI002B1FCAE0|nr:polysaccharide biosynthesis/export family protein [Spirulina sp. 06S082]MEA5469242.1 polysaccharide biosynthesis/export family protein [Spirulina sp. 06S082]